ncbi:uncharacterized protein LOC134504501 [Candoia aspera]|uniref:uncharacterized protein LOC134504501 n=1 Tax=Candoia aspera TaxID=51853 RepID=UPI002FD7F43A
MEQLKNIEASEQEKSDLLQKLQSSQVDVKAVSKEKDSLKVLAENLQAERDIMKNDMDGLYKTIEKVAAVKTLTAELAVQMKEEQQLVIENKRLQTNLQEAMLDNYHSRRVGDFWQTVFSLTIENDQLWRSLIACTEKEVVSILPRMQKKRDGITLLALKLKSDLEVVKAVAAKGLASLPLLQTANVLKLQMYYEQASDELYCVLTDIKYYFSEWYKESKDYYVSISKFTMNLLDENLKQLKLLIEIQRLNATGLNSSSSTSEPSDGSWISS